MKLSQYFLKTEKNVSDEDKSTSARLLKQAGYIRESVAGRYYFLPIGQRVQQKIISVVKRAMDKAGGQEMVSPILHPLELWKETNRTNTAGFELMKVKDRRGSEFALGGTAEEMFVDLVRGYTVSYKDLPFQLYQFSPKFRDEIRARGGLLRVREFIMKDGYSFHADETDFKKTYDEMKVVYTEIFKELGLDTVIVESDNGYIGGEYCHEFIVDSEIGESRYFVSADGSYAAHEDVAVFEKEAMNADEEIKELTEVDAPRGSTMEDGVAFHKLPLWRQIKDVLFVDDKGRFVLAVIRGDFDVNETKLAHLADTTTLRTATDEEIRDVLHSEPGFISPVGLSHPQLIIVADGSLRTIVNAYGGTNKKSRDFLNINIDRDYKPDIEGDIALAKEGYSATGGCGKLIEKKGIEVGNIFQLGYHYSSKMKGASYIDADGKEQPFYMGCYGIGIGRTMATIVEKYNDEKGMMWPESSSPFQVHLIDLAGNNEEVRREAEGLYARLQEKNIEVLWDDRDLRAGEKFADADLIGIPHRVVVSPKTKTEGKVEYKKRGESDVRLIDEIELVHMIESVL